MTVSHRKIVDRCPIDVFIASNMTYDYPYKLIKPEHANKRVSKSCDTLIMDSGIGDNVSNSRVLDLAQKHDADFVVAKDYLHDIDRTIESTNEFLNLWEDHDCRATPLIPLQPPHHEHYQKLDRAAYHVMLGGMAFDYSASEIIHAVDKFRRVAGDGPYVHLLGVGANPDVMSYLASNPTHVQSLDCSTTEQCAINGKSFDASLRQRNHQIRNGDESSHMRSVIAEQLAYQLNDAITMRYENTNTLEAWT